MALCCDQVTGAEYTRLYLRALEDTLNKYPPPQPSTAAVNLLVTVGQQQEFLLWHSLLPPPGHPGSLDALAVRAPHPFRCIFTTHMPLHWLVLNAVQHAVDMTPSTFEHLQPEIAFIV